MKIGENNCISISKLGGNTTHHSRKITKKAYSVSFFFMHETYSLHKDGGFANELNQL